MMLISNEIRNFGSMERSRLRSSGCVCERASLGGRVNISPDLHIKQIQISFLSACRMRIKVCPKSAENLFQQENILKRFFIISFLTRCGSEGAWGIKTVVCLLSWPPSVDVYRTEDIALQTKRNGTKKEMETRADRRKTSQWWIEPVVLFRVGEFYFFYRTHHLFDHIIYMENPFDDVRDTGARERPKMMRSSRSHQNKTTEEKKTEKREANHRK